MSSKYRGFSENSDSGRNYFSGAWGSGELDGAALAKKYGLDTSEQGRGEGHIWGRNADGSEVYIGKSSMDLAANKGLIANHSKQANDAEVRHSDKLENLSSPGDIKGAILTEWSGGPAAEKAIEETPEVQEPIQLSRSAATAKAQAQAYRDTAMIRDGDRIIGNDPTVIADFNDQVIKNTEYELQPKMPNELYNARQEAAQERANIYKLAVADQLKPSRAKLELKEMYGA